MADRAELSGLDEAVRAYVTAVIQDAMDDWLDRRGPENFDQESLADAVLVALRSLPVERRMEAMGMHRVDPFETFIAGDGEPAIRGRTDVWSDKP